MSQSVIKKELRHYNPASNLFSILAFNPDTSLFFDNDGYLCFAFLCTPASGGGLALADNINVALNQDWPKSAVMQFSLWSGPDVEQTLLNAALLRHGQAEDVLQHGINSRIQFMKQAARTPISPALPSKVRNTHLIISVKLPIRSQSPNPKEEKRAVELQQTLLQAFTTAGFGPKTLGPADYIRIMQTILNWDDPLWKSTSPEECYDENQLISQQLLDYNTQISNDRKNVYLGSKQVRMMSVKRFPKSAPFGIACDFIGDMMQHSRGIHQHCLISMTLEFPDHENTRSKLDKKRQWITNQTHGKMMKWIPALNAKKRGFDLLFNALEDGDRLVKAYLGIALFGDSEEEMTQASSNVRSYYRESSIQLMDDECITLPLFLNCLPLGADPASFSNTQRFKTMATRHAVRLLPIFAEWKGTGTPAMNFVSRQGQLMSMSFFDSSTNFNAIIAAESGSGKSVLVNEMISSYLSMGGRCWVIDVGRSYHKLCKFLGGQFIEFSSESDICLNPFSMVENIEEESDVIVGILANMANPKSPLCPYQDARLRETLQAVWAEHQKNTSIDLIAERLLEDEDQRVKDLGVQLYSFTSKGVYGKYFNGPANIDLSANLCVLELEELKTRKHLQQVVLLMLIYAIQQHVYKGRRDRPQNLIVDEAWELLIEGDIGKFIETGYRRMRKYGAQVTICTQSVNDLYASSNGVAIAENSANMYLLGQTRESIDNCKKEGRLSMEPGGYELLKTVRTEPGQYSEVFFKTKYGIGVGRLLLEPFKQLLYSTQHDEVQAIEDRMQNGMKVEEAILDILHHRGQS